MRRPRATRQSQPSLRRLALRLAMLITLVLLATALGGAVLVRQESHRLQHQEALEQATQLATAIGRELDHYRRFTARIAAQPAVRDLIEFGQPDEIRRWAIELRPLLPDAIGLALLTQAGDTLGDPQALRLSQLCIRDLHGWLHGQQVGHPPVHRRVTELAHFDILAAVEHPDGEALGLLFASFSLEVMQRLVDALIQQSGYTRMQLLDREGHPIASAGGQVQTGAPPPILVAVPDSDWRLQLHHAERPGPGPLRHPSMLVLLGLLITLGLVLLSHWRLDRTLRRDLEQLQQRLLASGPLPLDDAGTRLAETRALVSAIDHHIRRVGNERAALLDIGQRDPLTQLLNRRGLIQALPELAAARAAGEAIQVVALDLDGLKAINDRLGHAAGDAVIRRLAKAIACHIRQGDLCGRLGGDEFIVILRAMETTDVAAWFGRIRATLRPRRRHEPATGPQADVSAGQAPFPTLPLATDAASLEQVLAAADAALYQAKRLGGGRLVVAKPAESA